MAKLTLDDFRDRTERGETWTVKIGKDQLELTLRSPTVADAEAVAAIVAGDVADETPGVDLAIMRRAEHRAIVACVVEIEDPDDRMIPVIRSAGGQKLQRKLFEMCGLAARDDERVDDGRGPPEKKSRSATS